MGITSKVEESHILHGKIDVTLDFLFSSDRSVSLGCLSPLGSQLLPSLRSCVKTTLGVKDALGNTSAWGEKKNPRWYPFPMEERDILSVRVCVRYQILRKHLTWRPFFFSKPFRHHPNLSQNRTRKIRRSLATRIDYWLGDNLLRFRTGALLFYVLLQLKLKHKTHKPLFCYVLTN